MKLYVLSDEEKAFTDKGLALSKAPDRSLDIYDADFPVKNGMTVFCNTRNGKAYDSRESAEKADADYCCWGYPAVVDTSAAPSVVGKTFRVYLTQSGDGRFSVGLNVTGDPSSSRVKMFFPDRAWAGPIFEGYANIRITREFPSYGFFVGSMELMEEQAPDVYANCLADQIMEDNNRVCESSRIFRYQGERGCAYLVESLKCFCPRSLYFNFLCNEEGGWTTLTSEEVASGTLTPVSSAAEFVAKYCYDREDFNLGKNAAPIKMNDRCRPAPWDWAMNLLDSELERFSEAEDTDVEELLEILRDAHYITPVSYVDSVFFRYRDGHASKILSLSCRELQLVTRFIEEHNALAEKQLAGKIKAGKIHVAI